MLYLNANFPKFVGLIVTFNLHFISESNRRDSISIPAFNAHQSDSSHTMLTSSRSPLPSSKSPGATGPAVKSSVSISTSELQKKMGSARSARATLRDNIRAAARDSVRKLDVETSLKKSGCPCW